MEEVEGSLGYMIFSPDKYDDVILRYQVMTMNAATVLVAILNATDKGTAGDLGKCMIRNLEIVGESVK